MPRLKLAARNPILRRCRYPGPHHLRPHPRLPGAHEQEARTGTELDLKPRDCELACWPNSPCELFQVPTSAHWVAHPGVISGGWNLGRCWFFFKPSFSQGPSWLSGRPSPQQVVEEHCWGRQGESTHPGRVPGRHIIYLPVSSFSHGASPESFHFLFLGRGQRCGWKLQRGPTDWEALPAVCPGSPRVMCEEEGGRWSERAGGLTDLRGRSSCRKQA